MSDATTPISEDSNLEELCRAAADGELDQESARRLNELVRTDESARKFYLDYLEVHALLAWRHDKQVRDSGRCSSRQLPSL